MNDMDKSEVESIIKVELLYLLPLTVLAVVLSLFLSLFV